MIVYFHFTGHYVELEQLSFIKSDFVRVSRSAFTNFYFIYLFFHERSINFRQNIMELTLTLFIKRELSLNIQSLFFFSAVDFFNQINMLYGTITEFCSAESCPVMSAGPK